MTERPPPTSLTLRQSEPDQSTVSDHPDARSGLLSPDFPYQFHGDSQTSPLPAPPRYTTSSHHHYASLHRKTDTSLPQLGAGRHAAVPEPHEAPQADTICPSPSQGIPPAVEGRRRTWRQLTMGRKPSMPGSSTPTMNRTVEATIKSTSIPFETRLVADLSAPFTWPLTSMGTNMCGSPQDQDSMVDVRLTSVPVGGKRVLQGAT